MQNVTIFQFFHWYISADGNLWHYVAGQAGYLASLGITHVWLPPAYKSGLGVDEPGYAVYDLYDLGEFNQKGTIRTRYGTKEELLSCIQSLHKHKLYVLADIVLNHRLGADEREMVTVQQVDSENRKHPINEEQVIPAFTKFNFPGRGDTYSTYKWNQQSFTGISGENNAVFLIRNQYTQQGWDEMIEDEKGNYDYLMGADVEFRNPDVKQELKRWGEWFLETTGVDGFRLDALKHIPWSFYNEWLDHLQQAKGSDLWCIGEYWRKDLSPLLKYIGLTGGRIQLFDVPLHYNFYEASRAGAGYDMRSILDNTLVQQQSGLAVTFVDNHDTQPLQAMESFVDYWFQPLAYAIILLRQQGIPCIFFPSLYGAWYEGEKDGKNIFIELAPVSNLDKMIVARSLLSYGTQKDYFDHPNIIGWVRQGNEEQEFSGLAVLLSNGDNGSCRMEIGKQHRGKQFIDICGGRLEKITIDENGEAEFFVNGGSVSVWIDEKALPLFAKTKK